MWFGLGKFLYLLGENFRHSCFTSADSKVNAEFGVSCKTLAVMLSIQLMMSKKAIFHNTCAVLYRLYWGMFSCLPQQKPNLSQSASFNGLYAFGITLQRTTRKIINKTITYHLCSSLMAVNTFKSRLIPVYEMGRRKCGIAQ